MRTTKHWWHNIQEEKSTEYHNKKWRDGTIFWQLHHSNVLHYLAADMWDCWGLVLLWNMAGKNLLWNCVGYKHILYTVVVCKKSGIETYMQGGGFTSPVGTFASLFTKRHHHHHPEVGTNFHGMVLPARQGNWDVTSSIHEFINQTLTISICKEGLETLDTRSTKFTFYGTIFVCDTTRNCCGKLLKSQTY